jgi:hypothetical protein
MNSFMKYSIILIVAFLNFNHRFHQLLNSLSPLFKTQYNPLLSEDVFINNWKQMIHLNRQQIVSVNLWMSYSINLTDIY